MIIGQYDKWHSKCNNMIKILKPFKSLNLEFKFKSSHCG